MRSDFINHFQMLRTKHNLLQTQLAVKITYRELEIFKPSYQELKIV